MDNPLLRKAAVDRLASPEQLDTAMRVTQPWGWWALAFCGALIGAAVIWSLVGEINERVDAHGIFLRGESIPSVQSLGDGRVEKIFVTTGTSVEKGAPIAQLYLPEMKTELEGLEKRKGELETQRSQQNASVSAMRSSYEAQIAALTKQLRNLQDLRRKGLTREQDVQEVQIRIDSVRAQIHQTGVGVDSRDLSLNDTTRRLEQLQIEYDVARNVKSEYNGVVSAVLVFPGQLVKKGDRLVNLEEIDQALKVVLFVPFGDGKRVKTGMPVRIAPSNIRSEESGWILAKVASVSKQSVTIEEVRRTLSDEELTRRFAKDSPFEVIAHPEVKDGRLQWTSHGDFQPEISGSTPCNARIIVATKKPISYVIPWFKKTVFGGV